MRKLLLSKSKKTKVLFANILGVHRLLILSCFIFLPLFSFGQLSVGAAAVYDNFFERGGIQVRGMYEINKRLRPSLDVIFYTSSIDFISTSLSFNPNLHFLLINKEKVRVYGLGGFNFTRYRINTTAEKIIRTDSRLNVGGGIDFNLSKSLSAMGEVKYDFKYELSRWVTSVGVIYKF